MHSRRPYLRSPKTSASPRRRDILRAIVATRNRCPPPLREPLLWKLRGYPRVPAATPTPSSPSTPHRVQRRLLSPTRHPSHLYLRGKGLSEARDSAATTRETGDERGESEDVVGFNGNPGLRRNDQPHPPSFSACSNRGYELLQAIHIAMCSKRNARNHVRSRNS